MGIGIGLGVNALSISGGSSPGAGGGPICPAGNVDLCATGALVPAWDGNYTRTAVVKNDYPTYQKGVSSYGLYWNDDIPGSESWKLVDTWPSLFAYVTESVASTDCNPADATWSSITFSNGVCPVIDMVLLAENNDFLMTENNENLEFEE